MHYLKHLATVALSFIFAIVFVSLPACAEPITIDTTIDGSSPFNETGITVSDGSDGPTTVYVVDGGGVAGFELQESSHLILDGGDVTFLSRLTDNSTFTILSGRLGCSEPVCQVIDFNTLINATGNSAILLKGDFSGADFSLRDDSTLTILGTGLSMFDPTSSFEFTVQGILLDGTPFQTRVSSRPEQIILLEVPEPTGAFLLFSSLFFFAPLLRE